MKKVTEIKKRIDNIQIPQKSFPEMMKEIAPYRRIRKIGGYSTAGKWKNTSDLC